MPVSPFDTTFAHDIYKERYQHPEDKNWDGTSRRVTGSVMPALYHAPNAPKLVSFIEDHTEAVYELHRQRKFIAGGRYLYAAGRDFHQVNNCLLMRCGDSRESWAELSYHAEMALMTGAGIGVFYDGVRPSGARIERTGGIASGPVPKMEQVNETGRHTMQGGNRRSAIWAGLLWSHPDIFRFISVKDWSEEVKALKEKDWTFPAPCDMTNISVVLDDAFFEAYSNNDPHAHLVYDTALEHMLKHGEPGFSVDTGARAGENLRNACTEITSADDSDVCNLGSLVLPRFSSPEEFGRAVREGVLFLTAGSLYSHVPYKKVSAVRDKNRRLGLGIIGVHEFLMKHGVKYGTDESFEVLEPYMREYAQALAQAHEYQNELGLSLSKGATAVAPNGTIGIVAESTPSADPLFSAAEIRSVKTARPTGDSYERHVVVDPTAARLVREGVNTSLIEDANTLALYPERRLALQAYIQEHVDHGVSSTINLPHVVNDPQERKNFGETLMRYLPKLRGVTVYPDGARSGQPRSSVDLNWAIERQGTVIEGVEATCVGGFCGV